MEVNLIDGTYELLKHFYALPAAKDSEGREVAAVRGVLGSLLGMMQAGKTYIGVATDHVIESFRNRMWPGYKTGPLMQCQGPQSTYHMASTKIRDGSTNDCGLTHPVEGRGRSTKQLDREPCHLPRLKPACMSGGFSACFSRVQSPEHRLR
jgi:hypothetical protein